MAGMPVIAGMMVRHSRIFILGGSLVLLGGLASAAAPPASAQGSAPGAPGANATWDEPSVTGFADSLGSSSKVWYTIGNGELENAFYPETDTPDTFGLQYAVTNGSSFTELETTGTTHAISLLNNSSLVWKQVNTADNGDFTITKTYIADPSRSVILVQTTFDNTSSSALKLYVDYHPQLDNDGMGNTGDTDSASGDLVSQNGSVASALTASTGFTQTTNGYVGTSSDGETMLTSSYGLTSTYSQASTAGHIDQVAQIPVNCQRLDHVHPRARLRHHRGGGHLGRIRLAHHRVHLLGELVRVGLAVLAERAERRARLGDRQPVPAGAVLRLADGGEGRRGQDLHRGVHRGPDRAVGRERQRGQRRRAIGRARLPRRLDAG